MRLFALTTASLAFATAASADTAATSGPSNIEIAESVPAIEAPAANALSFSSTITFASRYVSDGVAYSDGPVIQPYVELGFGGFYAGVWATNASADLLGADSEVDFYVGYRGEAGTFYYDVGYGYYTYPGLSSQNSGEVLASGGVGFNETVYVTAYLAYANEAETLDKSLRVDYSTPVSGLAVAATVGDNESWRYWSAGASYAVNDMITADVTWHDTDLVDTDGLFVAGVTFSF
jgi:uncharacterized protein (TIGR02001 family)